MKWFRGDLQTVYGALLRMKKSSNVERFVHRFEQFSLLIVHAYRTIITVSDNGTIALDFIANPGLDEKAPTVILFPGLSGSSDDSYVICAYQELVKFGYRVIIMNCRGGANSPLTSPHFTHSGSVEDARMYVFRRAKFPGIFIYS